VRKVRLTGGEPLLRQEVELLVEMLAAIPGLDLTMTTNGALLAEKAQALKDAGLQRITVSLDSLDERVFSAMNDVAFPVARVLEGIEAASKAGLQPIKINMVVQRGMNEDSILPMARHFRGTGHILRFIEFMDVGHTNGWRMEDVIPAREILARIDAEMPIEPVEPNYRGEVALRWRYRDGSGEIGLIASVSQPFCVYTCLFAVKGFDLKSVLRSGASDDDLLQTLRQIWEHRTDRYSEIRSSKTVGLQKIEMSFIGG
jgi:cyclic pyranopterin phosphate synthase